MLETATHVLVVHGPLKYVPKLTVTSKAIINLFPFRARQVLQKAAGQLREQCLCTKVEFSGLGTFRDGKVVFANIKDGPGKKTLQNIAGMHNVHRHACTIRIFIT